MNVAGNVCVCLCVSSVESHVGVALQQHATSERSAVRNKIINTKHCGSNNNCGHTQHSNNSKNEFTGLDSTHAHRSTQTSERFTSMCCNGLQCRCKHTHSQSAGLLSKFLCRAIAEYSSFVHVWAPAVMQRAWEHFNCCWLWSALVCVRYMYVCVSVPKQWLT